MKKKEEKAKKEGLVYYRAHRGEVLVGLENLKEMVNAYRKSAVEEGKKWVLILCHDAATAEAVGELGMFSCWSADMDRRLKSQMTFFEGGFDKVVYAARDMAGMRSVSLRYDRVYVLHCFDVLGRLKGAENRCEELRGLVERASRLRFWGWRTTDHRATFEVNTEDMMWCLNMHGYYRYVEENGERVFVHVDANHVVEKVEGQSLRDFVLWYVYEKDGKSGKVAAQKSNYTKAVMFEDLPTLEVFSEGKECFDFSYYGYDYQYWFFRNCCVRVTAGAVEVVEKPDVYVWRDRVIDFDFEPKGKVMTREGNVLRKESPLMRVVMQTSRTHWRVEYEGRMSADAEEEEAYRRGSRFTLEGSRLTDGERSEQRANFLSKCWSLGYILHRYKNHSFPLALWNLEDSTVGNKSSSGRSGKSFLYSTIIKYRLLNVVDLNGKAFKATDRFSFQTISRNTDLLFVDDCVRNMNVEDYYNVIAGSIQVEEKQKKPYSLPFDKTPKVVFASNSVPRNAYQPSTRGRLQYVVFSDWYHVKTEDNDYRESRSIADDFMDEFRGGIVCAGDGYGDAWRNEDYGFLLWCVAYYLEMVGEGARVEPPMGKVQRRIDESSYGESFEEWANTFFSEDMPLNFNTLVRQDKAYQDFLNMEFLSRSAYSMHSFTKQLKNYCRAKGYALNPESPGEYGSGEVYKLARDGRILKWVTDGQGSGNRVFFFVGNKRVQPEVLRERAERSEEEEDDESPF